MTRPAVTNATQAFLDAVTPPKGSATTPHTDSLYEMVEPIHAVIEHMEDRVRELARLLRAADRVENGEHAHAFFNRFRESFKAAARQATDILNALRELTDTAFQIDSYALDMNTSLDTHDERHPSEPLVMLRASEHAALVARAALAPLPTVGLDGPAEPEIVRVTPVTSAEG